MEGSPSVHHLPDMSQKVIEAALERSDLILFVVDSSSRADYQDRVISERLHDLGKPVILVINKIDTLPSGVSEEVF
jgi:GTPase